MTTRIDLSVLAPFEQVVAQRLGMRCDDSGRERLREAVQKRVEQTCSQDAAQYFARLASPMTAELSLLAQELTVGESYFFRERDHFRALADTVLPTLQAVRRGSGRLRLLSAGCATGEEPYTLAIVLLESLPGADPRDIEIVGVDVNAASVEKARRAEYSAWSLRSLSDEQKQRYFRPCGERYLLADEIRERVRFEALNLLDESPGFWQPGRFDVVFCRNVLIYFTVEAMTRLVARFHEVLSPDGFLFLGHSETLRGLSRAFHLCQTHETFYYQRRDGEIEIPALAEALWQPPSFAPVGAAPDAPANGFERGLPEDTSWVEAVQGATRRIAAIADKGPARESRPPVDLSMRAMELFRAERYVEAVDLLRAVPAEARNAEGMVLLAAALTQRGQVAEAERACREILDSDELNPEAMYLLAVCREHSGDLRAATESAQAAIYLAPDFAMPHLLLGRLLRRAGDRAQARRELGLALELFVRDHATRILLFGGGFTREVLAGLCRSELKAVAG